MSESLTVRSFFQIFHAGFSYRTYVSARAIVQRIYIECENEGKSIGAFTDGGWLMQAEKK